MVIIWECVRVLSHYVVHPETNNIVSQLYFNKEKHPKKLLTIIENKECLRNPSRGILRRYDNSV